MKKGIWWLAIESEDILPLIEGLIPEGQVLVEHFHCTLSFNVTEEQKPKVFEQFNGKVLVALVTLVHDSKCTALAVVPYAACQNRYPHITVALSGNTPPVYSNTLLASKPTDNVVFMHADIHGKLEFKPFD